MDISEYEVGDEIVLQISDDYSGKFLAAMTVDERLAEDTITSLRGLLVFTATCEILRGVSAPEASFKIEGVHRPEKLSQADLLSARRNGAAILIRALVCATAEMHLSETIKMPASEEDIAFLEAQALELSENFEEVFKNV